MSSPVSTRTSYHYQTEKAELAAAEYRRALLYQSRMCDALEAAKRGVQKAKCTLLEAEKQHRTAKAKYELSTAELMESRKAMVDVGLHVPPLDEPRTFDDVLELLRDNVPTSPSYSPTSPARPPASS